MKQHGQSVATPEQGTERAQPEHSAWPSVDQGSLGGKHFLGHGKVDKYYLLIK